MLYLDAAGRISIPRSIWPYNNKKGIRVAVFYSPLEGAIGLLPEEVSHLGFRIIGNRYVDAQARINIKSYLPFIGEKSEKFLVYSLNDIIYIKGL